MNLNSAYQVVRHVRPLHTEQISEEGSHTYRLKLNITDEIPENNQASAVVQISG